MKVTLSNGKFCAFLMIRIRILLRKNIARKEALQKQSMIIPMDYIKRMLTEYTNASPARFHMPGHKGSLYPYDITELDFSDDLHAPLGVIAQAQSMVASVYGAKGALFSVNGSTAGILAFQLALAARKRSPRVLVGRDAHRSFVNAAVLAGSVVNGVYPNRIQFGVVNAQDVEAALDNWNADAVCVTSPNYYGVTADIKAISEICHAHGALLFVDAAHAAHFPFSKYLPESPCKYADVSVVSTHKTLNALGQSAVVLVNDDRISEREIADALSSVQTTSPSYLLMNSIEQAIEHPPYWDAHMTRVRDFRADLARLGVQVAELPNADISRVCILADGMAESGYALNAKFTEHKIYAEMADGSCVVLITSPVDHDEWYERVIAVCSVLAGKCKTPVRFSCEYAFPSDECAEFCPRDALCLRSETIPFETAAGRRAKYSIGLYPPGISVVFPYETITDNAVRFVSERIKAGSRAFGVNGGMTRVLCNS